MAGLGQEGSDHAGFISPKMGPWCAKIAGPNPGGQFNEAKMGRRCAKPISKTNNQTKQKFVEQLFVNTPGNKFGLAKF